MSLDYRPILLSHQLLRETVPFSPGTFLSKMFKTKLKKCKGVNNWTLELRLIYFPDFYSIYSFTLTDF
jgi:hypothetical protein